MARHEDYTNGPTRCADCQRTDGTHLSGCPSDESDAAVDRERERREYSSAMQIAAVNQRAAIADDAAVEPWMRAECDGRVFTYRDAMHAHLFAAREEALDRGLTLREREGLGNLVRHFWPEYAAAQGVNPLALSAPLPTPRLTVRQVQRDLAALNIGAVALEPSQGRIRYHEVDR